MDKTDSSRQKALSDISQTSEPAKDVKEVSIAPTSSSDKDKTITLPSGLKYRIIKEGTGNIPKRNDSVLLHYRGTFVDGTEFDSSYGRGKPDWLPVNELIPGWTEALLLMKVGSKWHLVIPPKLAYGKKGAGPIGPDATLIFDVELISVLEK